jgi:ribosome-interacting GTPase 1
VGIRLNTKPPDVVFKQKSAGGVSERASEQFPVVIVHCARTDDLLSRSLSVPTRCDGVESRGRFLIDQINCTVKLTHTDERTIRSILQTYRSERVDSDARRRS